MAMVKVDVDYVGGLHCVLTHGPSKTQIETDAPLDNNGKGEKFSPTDLVGAALGSCILTVMAIRAEKDGVVLKGAQAHVEKEMTSTPPRRVASLTTTITMPAGIPRDYRARLEAVGHACPVHKSLHPDINSEMIFKYPD